ncbi:hypothetical protein [Terricaulis sp.]|uniref:hypothetical protein n=1 Tax=Terricaulis sp. TaxID=2768686 RepID=UPI0037831456
MGVKLLDEDGRLLHEFRDGLGVILLDRLLTAAKFRDDADWDILLNEHVASLATSVRNAMPMRRGPVPPPDDDLCRAASQRLTDCLRNHVLTGALPWPRWTAEQKTAFVRSVAFAPWSPSEQFVREYVEERDAEFARWRKSLDGVQ